jgi:hypothetical protein
MELPPPDPVKLLDHWMAWEKGDVPPGKTLSELKTGGLRQVLEDLVAAGRASGGGPPSP